MSNIIQTRPHNRLRLIAIPSAFQSSAPDSRAPEDGRRCYRFVPVWCALCVGVQSPAMRGSSELIELNGDDLRRDPLTVRKARVVESGRVLSLKPKKRGPFHRVAVIAKAIL